MNQVKRSILILSIVGFILFGLPMNVMADIEPYLTAPSDIPRMTVHTVTDETADGYIFMAIQHSRYTPYLLIYDNDGELVYYRETSGGLHDFKRQPTGELTWKETANEYYQVMDSTYTIVDTIAPVSFPYIDDHDFILTPDGRKLFLLVNPFVMDLTAEGGSASATVHDCAIQELDADDNPVFEWHALDHIPITDSYHDMTVEPVDPSHCNSIEYDFDGNILVSHRNFSEVTKINRTTGEVMWRLGGKQSDFTFINDDGFYYQHDARRLPDGSISLFDNRTGRLPPYSRAVRYQLDLESMTAEKIWEYRHPLDLYTGFVGNMQTLPNGNALINWGASVSDSGINASEVTADDEIVFEFGIDPAVGSYRIFRSPWIGIPAYAPTLLAESSQNDVTLYMSWNGGTEHVAYNVYHNAPTGVEQLIGTASRTGFEATYQTAVSDSGFHQYRVVPIDERGAEMLSSNNQTVLVGTQSHYLFLPVLVQN